MNNRAMERANASMGLQPAHSSSLADRLVALVEALLNQESSQDGTNPPRRKRGAPAKLPLTQLWLALLIATIRQVRHLKTIWRCLCVQDTGSFPAVHLSYEAVRKRLLTAGTDSLQALFVSITQALAGWTQKDPSSPESLAPFAKEVVALDETTFDALRRATSDLREVPDGNPHLLPGKLAGLFDLRSQRWLRLQFRADVLAGCNTGILLLLSGLQKGSLILADLGYFSFPWFDYLTEQGFFWVSRLKKRTTYEIVQVLASDDQSGLLDAIVWLGTYRADRAGNAVRLVIFSVGGQQYQYLTNVLDPKQLSMLAIAQLYSRRWDIELAFKLLKCELGLHLWWGARPELVMIQLWIALILAQLLHALQAHVAMQAQVEPFDVSLHVLVELLPVLAAEETSVVDRLIAQGRFLGLIRPSCRTTIVAPVVRPSMIVSTSCGKHLRRLARYASRNGHPRTQPFLSLFLTQLLI